MQNHTQRRAALHNLGCKVNAYETEAMGQQLEEAGYKIVPFQEEADVYIINTCSVTNMADRKSRQMLHRAKKMNPDAVVVAAGCYVQTANDKTHLEVDADIILGNNHKKDLVRALAEYFHDEERTQRLEEIDDLHRPSEYEYLKLTRTEEHTRAFVKVQDGCNQFCSYCIIPYARGRVRSRDAEDVCAELENLVKNGISEVVLTGIHLTSYGVDLGLDLLTLIKKAAAVEGIRRIRLGSLEPGVITEDFAGELAQIPQVCPHFHLSLQSGSDTVLRRMNRKYDSEEFLEKCEILRKHFDDPALTTDVIVGFPGETEEEFEQTYAFLKKIDFYETHIFRYSKRAGTTAARMDGQVDESVKAKRSEILIKLGKDRKEAYEKRHEDKVLEALLEEPAQLDGHSVFVGHTKEYLRVCMTDSEENLAGRIVRGTLTGRKYGDALEMSALS